MLFKWDAFNVLYFDVPVKSSLPNFYSVLIHVYRGGRFQVQTFWEKPKLFQLILQNFAESLTLCLCAVRQTLSCPWICVPCAGHACVLHVVVNARVVHFVAAVASCIACEKSTSIFGSNLQQYQTCSCCLEDLVREISNVSLILAGSSF